MNWLLRMFGKKDHTKAKAEVLEPFPPIDKEEIRNSTRLIEQAKTDGAKEHPASASTSNDENQMEVKIREKFREYQIKYKKNYENNQRVYLSRLKKISEYWNNVDTVKDDLRAASEGIPEGEANFVRIDTSVKTLESDANDLYNFRRDHELLYRTPKYQDVLSCYLFLLIAFAVELLITVFLLRESGGLPMVVVLSIMYCFLNCWVPIMIANKWGRYINYQWTEYPFKNLIGWIVTILTAIVLGGGLNLLMGHYRSAALELTTIDYQQYNLESLIEITEQVTNIGSTALDNFLASPCGINDVWSWLLAIAGYCIFLFGFWEGFEKDGHYPDYGEKARRYREQRDKHDADVSQSINTLKKRQNEVEKAIKNKKHNLSDDFSRDSKLRSSMEKCRRDYEDACRSLNDDFMVLIGQYRQTNKENRKTPAPLYFDDKPNLSQIKLTDIHEFGEPPPEFTQDRKNCLTEKLNDSTMSMLQPYEDLLDRIGTRYSQKRITDPLAVETKE